jgi:hypothetical protein
MLEMNTGADRTTKGFSTVSAVNELSDDERKALKGFAEVLKDFIALRPNMPMHQVVVMVQVALDEGKSLKHYSDVLEYPTATVSRAFLDNGQKMRNGEEGLGLLEARQSARSLREHETHLTTKGRKLLRDAAKKLAGKR